MNPETNLDEQPFSPLIYQSAETKNLKNYELLQIARGLILYISPSDHELFDLFLAEFATRISKNFIYKSIVIKDFINCLAYYYSQSNLDYCYQTLVSKFSNEFSEETIQSGFKTSIRNNNPVIFKCLYDTFSQKISSKYLNYLFQTALKTNPNSEITYCMLKDFDKINIDLVMHACKIIPNLNSYLSYEEQKKNPSFYVPTLT